MAKVACKFGKLLLITVAAAIPSAGAAERPAPAFLSADRLRMRLDELHSVAWSGPEATLRTAVYRLGAATETAVLLDRRVDPNRRVELSFTDTPLREIWRRLAATSGCGVSWFGPVVYIGPPASAAKLRTAAALRRQELQSLPTELRDAPAARRPLSWNDLEQPRELFVRLAGEAGLRVVNPEALPHDLWYHGDLPPLSLLERLSLIAVQFDATFRIDGASKRLTIEPLPEKIGVERTYGPTTGAAETARRWQALVPDAVVRTSGDKIVVTATEEDHERLAGGPSASAPRSPAPAAGPRPGAKQVHTLKVKNVPLSQLVGFLRSKGFEIRVDEAALARAMLSLDRPTSVDVDKASLVELLEQAAKPLGLTARTVGEAVEIVPRP